MSDIAGYSVVAGVFLECVFLAFSDKPFFEKTSGMFCDALIFVGVAGEIKFGNLAKSIGDLKISETDARAEEVRQRSLLLELKIAQLDRRHLNETHRELISKVVKGFGYAPCDFSVTPDADSVNLMRQIASILTESGWGVVPRSTGPGVVVNSIPGLPLVGSLIGSGSTIMVALERAIEWEQPAIMLAEALRSSGIEITFTLGEATRVETNAIHINIGAKI